MERTPARPATPGRAEVTQNGRIRLYTFDTLKLA